MASAVGRKEGNMHARREYSLFDRLLIVGAPLLLAVVEVFHPQPHELLNLDVHTWLAVHYAQVALFPLAVLVDAAHKSPAVDVWRAPIDAIWTHPVMGGMPGTGPNFAVLGAVALSVGA